MNLEEQSTVMFLREIISRIVYTAVEFARFGRCYV